MDKIRQYVCFNKLTCFADKYTSALAVLRHKITKNPKIFMMTNKISRFSCRFILSNKCLRLESKSI